MKPLRWLVALLLLPLAWALTSYIRWRDRKRLGLPLVENLRRRGL